MRKKIKYDDFYHETIKKILFRLTEGRFYAKIIAIKAQKDQKMIIRPATIADVDAANEIYDMARGFMRETGNPNQWNSAYPGKKDIVDGIADGTSYVCEDGGEIVATFYFKIGDDPTYAEIFDGAWLDSEPYAVIHRIAVKHHGRGIVDACFNLCFDRFPSLKIDTHEDNIPMQKCLERCGFRYCGIIYTWNGDKRRAYQKI